MAIALIARTASAGSSIVPVELADKFSGVKSVLELELTSNSAGSSNPQARAQLLHSALFGDSIILSEDGTRLEVRFQNLFRAADVIIESDEGPIARGVYADEESWIRIVDFEFRDGQVQLVAEFGQTVDGTEDQGRIRLNADPLPGHAEVVEISQYELDHAFSGGIVGRFDPLLGELGSMTQVNGGFNDEPEASLEAARRIVADDRVLLEPDFVGDAAPEPRHSRKQPTGPTAETKRAPLVESEASHPSSEPSALPESSPGRRASRVIPSRRESVRPREFEAPSTSKRLARASRPAALVVRALASGRERSESQGTTVFLSDTVTTMRAPVREAVNATERTTFWATRDVHQLDRVAEPRIESNFDPEVLDLSTTRADLSPQVEHTSGALGSDVDHTTDADPRAAVSAESDARDADTMRLWFSWIRDAIVDLKRLAAESTSWFGRGER